MVNKSIISWSGGKDSCFALYKCLQDPSLQITSLLTSISNEYQRISFHGIRLELLKKQADAINFPLEIMEFSDPCTMEQYEIDFLEHANKFKEKGNFKIVFGDIFLEDLKKYRVALLSKIQLQAIFPLWGSNTSELIDDFISAGFKTIVVSARKDLKHLCGKIIDRDFINYLPEGVDPCGENGEFHTFVIDGPLFKGELKYEIGELVFKPFRNENNTDLNGNWYLDLIPI